MVQDIQDNSLPPGSGTLGLTDSGAYHGHTKCWALHCASARVFSCVRIALHASTSSAMASKPFLAYSAKSAGQIVQAYFFCPSCSPCSSMQSPKGSWQQMLCPAQGWPAHHLHWHLWNGLPAAWWCLAMAHWGAEAVPLHICVPCLTVAIAGQLVSAVNITSCACCLRTMLAGTAGSGGNELLLWVYVYVAEMKKKLAHASK